MCPSWRLCDDPRHSVLDTLQLLNTADWSTIQHSIAVVQPRLYQAAGQSSSEFCGQQVTNMPDGSGMVVAGSCHRCDVSVECQTTIKYNANTFMSSASGRSARATVTDDVVDVTTCSSVDVPTTNVSDLSGLSCRPFCMYHCLT